MKTRFYILLTIAVFSNMALYGTVWRISNISGADAHFTSVQDAIYSNNVNSSDTLYIEPSPVSYGDAALHKTLFLIGNGFFLDENPEPPINKNSSVMGHISFDAGSEGSVITGCTISSITINSSVPDITIKRNLINGKIIINATNDISILSNFIKGSVYSTYISIPMIYATHADIYNLLISGNYIENESRDLSIDIGSSSSEHARNAIIENNVIGNGVTIRNSSFYNNILCYGDFIETDSDYTNNIGNSEQFGTENGNQQNINMLDVFVGEYADEVSTDGMWQLKEGSPAIGAGTGETDCGMFDGMHPYTLSGIPDIPSIFEYQQVYNHQTQEVEVTISIKSNN